MNRNIFSFLMLVIAIPFTSCNDDETFLSKTVTIETDFNQVTLANPTDGWVTVFAQYPESDSEFYELTSGIQNLPQPLDQSKKAFMLSGNNHSDALQMWLVKQLSGLKPDSKYSIETEVELASKYPDGSVGIGGSPGNSVHLVSKFATNGYTLENKKGSNIDLVLTKIESNSESVMSIDLGDVSIPSDQYIYKLITRKKSSDANVILTDHQGKVWAVIGTWSGFEGISTLYYTRIKFTLSKI
jgi:hypothetical protein